MINLYEAKITDFTQADYTNQYSLLECAIREKIDVKRQNKAKQQSLAGYILFYRAVKELFPHKQIKIYFNEHGKPLCDFCFFNFSHSGDHVVCAISDEPVGVDIQQIKAVKQREKYIFFTREENDYVNLNEKLMSERYIEVFTKKEAAIKMLGLSMSHAADIDTFSNKYCFKSCKKDDFFLTVCTKNVSVM